MKQVSNALKSFVLSSPRLHAIPQRTAFSKFLFVLWLAGFALFISSCQKDELQGSLQKQELQANSQKQDLLNSSQKQDHKEKSVPFKGKMNLIVVGNTVSGTGTASHIGRFTIVEPNNFVERIAGGLIVTGTAIITAANGDEIYATHRGEVLFLGNGMVQVTAEFTITGGTGRFAGATGSFEVRSLTNPGDYTFDGTISY